MLTTITLGIIVCFFLVGLALQWQASYFPDFAGRFLDSGGMRLYKRIIYPFWPLWLIPVVITVIVPGFSLSYYDYYVGNINRDLLLVIWFLAFSIFGIRVMLSESSSSLMLRIMTIVVMFSLVPTFMFLIIPRASQSFEGVINGPRYGEGIAEKKYYSSIVRGGITYYIEIDTRLYQTPDVDWYKRILVGEPISYAYNPSATYWRPEVFDPTRIELSSWGMVMLIAALINWLITSFLVVDGWLSVIYRNR